MCDCIRAQEKRIKEQIPLKNAEYKDLNIELVYFDNHFISDEGKDELGIPLTIEHIVPFKKGPKTRKKHIYMSMIYCPFCGEKIKE